MWGIGVSKTRDYIHTKIKIPIVSQEPPVSSKAQNPYLKEIDILCTFKSRQGYKIWNKVVS